MTRSSLITIESQFVGLAMSSHSIHRPSGWLSLLIGELQWTTSIITTWQDSWMEKDVS